MNTETETTHKKMHPTLIRRWIRQQFIAAPAFVLIAILIWGLYSSVEKEGLGSSEAAGWMQAIGSVFAVAAAILIAKNQSELTLKAIANAQKLAEESKKNGVLAVVRAANSRAKSIGDAVTISDELSLKIYDVYDKTIITGMVETLSAAPLYEIGSPKAIEALLSIRDQFAILGTQVEAYIAGPWKHKYLGPELKKLSEPEYSTHRATVFTTGKQVLATNVTTKVKYIQDQCSIIENALRS